MLDAIISIDDGSASAAGGAAFIVAPAAADTPVGEAVAIGAEFAGPGGMPFPAATGAAFTGTGAVAAAEAGRLASHCRTAGSCSRPINSSTLACGGSWLLCGCVGGGAADDISGEEAGGDGDGSEDGWVLCAAAGGCCATTAPDSPLMGDAASRAIASKIGVMTEAQIRRMPAECSALSTDASTCIAAAPLKVRPALPVDDPDTPVFPILSDPPGARPSVARRNFQPR
jgi:hypothetical protein